MSSFTDFSWRSYQPPAIEWLASRPRGLIDAPAASGKTCIAAGALHRVVMAKNRSRKASVGWLANTLEQCSQAYEAMLQIFYGVKVEPTKAKPEWESRCHEGDGAKIDLKVACAAANTDWSDRDVLIGDEIHHAGTAVQWQSQIETCRGAFWGFTATVPEDEEAYKTLMDFFDGEHYTITREDVKANLAPAKIIMLSATDPGIGVRMDSEITAECRKRRNWWMAGKIPKQAEKISRLRNSGASEYEIGKCASELYGLEQEMKAQVMWGVLVKRGIVENRSRNEEAISIAKKHRNDTVIVLVNQVEHGKELADRIPDAVVVHSKMGIKARRSALEKFNSGEIKTIISTSLLDEGANFPRSNVLIMLSAGRSSARVTQRTGRVLRSFPGKEYGLIYDWTDDFHALAKKHSDRRREVYTQLGYEFVNPNSLFG
jgi:superfamily II DNA or RNA helicase